MAKRTLKRVVRTMTSIHGILFNKEIGGTFIHGLKHRSAFLAKACAKFAFLLTFLTYVI